MLDVRARHVEPALDLGANLVILDARGVGASEGGIIVGGKAAIAAAAANGSGIGVACRASARAVALVCQAVANFNPDWPPLPSAGAAR